MPWVKALTGRGIVKNWQLHLHKSKKTFTQGILEIQAVLFLYKQNAMCKEANFCCFFHSVSLQIAVSSQRCIHAH